MVGDTTSAKALEAAPTHSGFLGAVSMSKYVFNDGRAGTAYGGRYDSSTYRGVKHGAVTRGSGIVDTGGSWSGFIYEAVKFHASWSVTVRGQRCTSISTSKRLPGLGRPDPVVGISQQSSRLYLMGIDMVYHPRFASAAAFGSGEFVRRAVGKHPTTSEPPTSVCDSRTFPPVASKSAEQDIKYTRDTGGGALSLDTTRDVVISRGITAGSTRRGGGNTARRCATKPPSGRTWHLKAA
ncbi:hypothetical protein OF83DRAFT_1085710 [Amylostereum chailletii]|nr:hypothetical protein OF83DRAFT_1085710 [Amylostereum chailletii]